MRVIRESSYWRYADKVFISFRWATRALSSVYLKSVRLSVCQFMLFVWMENRTGDQLHPCGTLVFETIWLDFEPLTTTCCGLSCPTISIHSTSIGLTCSPEVNWSGSSLSATEVERLSHATRSMHLHNTDVITTGL